MLGFDKIFNTIFYITHTNFVDLLILWIYCNIYISLIELTQFFEQKINQKKFFSGGWVEIQRLKQISLRFWSQFYFQTSRGSTSYKGQICEGTFLASDLTNKTIISMI